MTAQEAGNRIATFFSSKPGFAAAFIAAHSPAATSVLYSLNRELGKDAKRKTIRKQRLAASNHYPRRFPSK